MVSMLVWALAPGCGPSGATAVPIERWCVAMETALRDRDALCDCPRDAPTDAEIEARCAALDAGSFLALYDDDAIGWNGAIAAARVRALDSCEDRPDPFVDDPVLGTVPPGGRCQVFADVWGQPDDCAHGAQCLVALGSSDATCVELVGEGESCEEPRACEPGLVCGEGASCAALPPVTPGERPRGEPCADDGECADANCVAGSCAAPACSVP